MACLKLSSICTFIFVILAVATALAETPVCYNGSPENMQIHKYLSNLKFTESPTSLAEAYVQQLKAGPHLFSGLARTTVGCANGPKDTLEGLKAVKDYFSNFKLPTLAQACIKFALARDIDGENILCLSDSDSSQKTVVSTNTESGFCITDLVVNYITWATNLALDCFSPAERPIDPLLIFSLLNNESGFHFSLFTKKGVGIGALTSDAIKDMNGPYTRVFKSAFLVNKPACKIFQKAMATPAANAKNSCPLNNPGMGLARSLAYSVGYFLRLRDEINSDIKKLAKKLKIEDIRFENLAALITYSRHGGNSKTEIKRLLRLHHSNFDHFKAAIEKAFTYAEEVKDSNLQIPNLNSCL